VFGEIKAEKEVTLAYEGYGGLGKQDGHIGKARKYLTKPLKIFERLGEQMDGFSGIGKNKRYLKEI